MSADQSHALADECASQALTHEQKRRPTLSFAVLCILTCIAWSAFTFWVFVAWCRMFYFLDYRDLFTGVPQVAFTLSLIVAHGPVFIFWTSPRFSKKQRYFLPLLLSLACLLMAEGLFVWAWPAMASSWEWLGAQVLILLMMFVCPYVPSSATSRRRRVRRGFLVWLRDPHHQGLFQWLRSPEV